MNREATLQLIIYSLLETSCFLFMFHSPVSHKKPAKYSLFLALIGTKLCFVYFQFTPSGWL